MCREHPPDNRQVFQSVGIQYVGAKPLQHFEPRPVRCVRTHPFGQADIKVPKARPAHRHIRQDRHVGIGAEEPVNLFSPAEVSNYKPPLKAQLFRPQRIGRQMHIALAESSGDSVQRPTVAKLNASGSSSTCRRVVVAKQNDPRFRIAAASLRQHRRDIIVETAMNKNQRVHVSSSDRIRGSNIAQRRSSFLASSITTEPMSRIKRGDSALTRAAKSRASR